MRFGKTVRSGKTLRFAAELLAAALLASTLATASLAAPAPASAQVNIGTPHRGSRPLQLDFHGGFTWWGFGAVAGARFGIPLVQNGFISSINNAFYLNFGADFYFVRCRCGRGGRDEYWPGFGIPITGHWEFYFSETWSVFVEAGLNIYFHPRWLRGNGGFFDDDAGAWFIGAVGARLHFSDSFGLVLRLGTPYASFGITFFFG